jgi:hypothetical protein
VSTCPRLEAHRSGRAASITSPYMISNLSRLLSGDDGFYCGRYSVWGLAGEHHTEHQIQMIER